LGGRQDIRVRCRGEWQLDAAVHNLRKLHRDSVCHLRNQEKGGAKARKKA